MQISDTFYIHRDTWMHRADPRVKVFFVLSIWIVIFASNSLPVSLAILLCLHALLFSARIPLHNILFIWKAFLPINITIPLLWALFQPVGAPLWSFGWIHFTFLGLLQGVVVALRIDAMAFLLFSWLFTTDPNAIVRGFVKLKMPYAWGVILTLTLHYIPSFQALYQSILEAQQARGLRIEGKGFQRVRRMMPVFITLVISVLRSSDQLSRALEARGFGRRGVHPTFMHETAMRPADYLYVGAILAATALLLWLRFG